MDGKINAPRKEETRLRRLTEVASIMKALSHPSRLLILEALAETPHCVCELTRLVGADTSTVSKHLSVLKNAGIVFDEKRGNMVFYSLICSCVLEAMAKVGPLLEHRFRHYSTLLDKD